MPWGQWDDQLYDNGKVASFTDKEYRLWGNSISYANRHLTGGHLTEAQVRVLTSPIKATQRTIDGLVAKRGWERVDDGYMIHDFLEFNRTPADVLAEREAARARAKAARERRTGKPDDDERTPEVRRTYGEVPANVRRTYGKVRDTHAHADTETHAEAPSHGEISVNGASDPVLAPYPSTAQRAREPDEGQEQGELDQVEPMPDFEQFAVETARAFGEPRKRTDYGRELTAIYRRSDHLDPAAFLLVAHRARDQTQRQKRRRKHAYFVATLTNRLRE
jgi:hypothetical protein